MNTCKRFSMMLTSVIDIAHFRCMPTGIGDHALSFLMISCGIKQLCYAFCLKRRGQAVHDFLLRSGFITDGQLQFIYPHLNPRPRLLYTLPKIHKPPELRSVPFCIPPGRPIISDIDSESYHVAEYIDHFLKPITFLQRPYIKDSFHFLECLKQVTFNLEHCFLVTCDVESMYTNINSTDGLKTVEFFFNNYPDAKRPDGHILDLLKISLFNNDFLFNGKFRLQKSGTAMGKIFAPSYANLLMAKIEEDFFQSINFRRPPLLCQISW